MLSGTSLARKRFWSTFLFLLWALNPAGSSAATQPCLFVRLLLFWICSSSFHIFYCFLLFSTFFCMLFFTSSLLFLRPFLFYFIFFVIFWVFVFIPYFSPSHLELLLLFCWYCKPNRFVCIPWTSAYSSVRLLAGLSNRLLDCLVTQHTYRTKLAHFSTCFRSSFA